MNGRVRDWVYILGILGLGAAVAGQFTHNLEATLLGLAVYLNAGADLRALRRADRERPRS